jgi:hypothetical protein
MLIFILGGGVGEEGIKRRVLNFCPERHFKTLSQEAVVKFCVAWPFFHFCTETPLFLKDKLQVAATSFE